MEFHLSSIPMLITFFLFMVLLLFIATTMTYKSKRPPSNLPPGPWKLPLVGNLHQLAVSSLVHHTLTKLAKTYGPLMHLQLGETSIVVVSSAEMAEEIMKKHDPIFAYRPHMLAGDILFYNSSDILFSPYGDYWKQLRKICTMELLSPQRVQTYRGIREEEVMNLITSISLDAARGGPLNLSRRLSSLAYGITARAAFGKKSKHEDEFISLVTETSDAIAGFSIADIYPSVKFLHVVTGVRKKLEKLHKSLDQILQAILDDHKEDQEGRRRENTQRESADLVNVLLRIQKREEIQVRLTDDNIKAVILDIFSGGSDPTSSSVEWAMCEMLKDPQVMQRARDEVRAVFATKGNVDESGLAELNYLKMVIKETLRLHPPAPLAPRASGKDCEINGYVIPAKTKVLVNVWAIGRDPINWIQPDKFDPDRFLNSEIGFQGSTSFNYIPFGGGRRMCPGIAFASPTMELILAQLLYHFDWQLPGGLQAEEMDMAEAFSALVRRKNDLLVTATPYHFSSIVI